LKIASGIRAVPSGTGVVLLDLNKGGTFGANVVGARIWNKLTQGVPIEQIINEVSNEFSVSRELVERDVREFLCSLKKQGLVQSNEV
jgi:hypothetical protein